MKHWSEIEKKVAGLLYEKALADCESGQRWITVTPDGEVYLSETFSGDNSYVPGDDRIQLLRTDIRHSNCCGGFEFDLDPEGLVLVDDGWDWPSMFTTTAARDEWEAEQRADGRATGTRMRIIGLRGECEAEMLSEAEKEYEEALEELAVED